MGGNFQGNARKKTQTRFSDKLRKRQILRKRKGLDGEGGDREETDRERAGKGRLDLLLL